MSACDRRGPPCHAKQSMNEIMKSGAYFSFSLLAGHFQLLLQLLLLDLDLLQQKITKCKKEDILYNIRGTWNGVEQSTVPCEQPAPRWSVRGDQASNHLPSEGEESIWTKNRKIKSKMYTINIFLSKSRVHGGFGVSNQAGA